MAVTPQAGLVSVVSVGGTAVTPVAANPNGGFIQNPYSADDQGLADPEVMYVDPVTTPGSAPGDGHGTTFVLYPGQMWNIIAGQTTPTQVNAASSGHRFSVVRW